MACHIICNVQYFSNNHYVVFIVNANNRTSLTMPFGYGTLDTKRTKKGMPPQRRRGVPPQIKREVKNTNKTVSADLKEEKIVVATSSIFDVNQYLKYENDKQQTRFDNAFNVRCTVGFVFLNKYDATKNNPWGEKGDIISKLRNDINIPDGNNSLMICRIMKEVLLAKADGVKLEPNLKGWRKTWGKSIIGMYYKEAQIIADVVESGRITLTAWYLVNDHMELRSFYR